MFETRHVAKVFRFAQDMEMAFDDFVAEQATEVASINISRKTVEMRDGSSVYFYTIRNERDLSAVTGMQFNSIECAYDVEHDVQQYLRSRLRSPFGNVDEDLIITGA